MNSNQNYQIYQYDLKNIAEDCVDKEIYVYGRIHKIRSLGKRCFILLRDQIYSIQCVVNRGENEEDKIFFKDICKLVPESFVKVIGIISRLPEHVPRIESAYYKNFEMVITKRGIELISKSINNLPFCLDDVISSYNNINNDKNNVLLHTRLDNRSFDLRLPFNNCIFKIQSAVCHLFRMYLFEHNFIEIHSPKIIGTISEGGASVFQTDYFKNKVYLAQSPQLYKQMCINSDFNRVFEIGPVFRAENCISHRHLCEYISLDIEMALTPGKNYYEIIETIWLMLCYIFKNLEIICRDQLLYIKSISQYIDIIYPSEPLIIDFRDAVKMLNEAGYQQNELEDLNSQNERILGELVRSKYNSDLFILNKYPLAVRPFYTMPDNENSLYSNSFDIILRGQEISSGSQRIHDQSLLFARLLESKLDPQNFSDYLKSFSYGSRSHGGCGFGLERIVMLYLNINNIRETSLYPRDPVRILP